MADNATAEAPKKTAAPAATTPTPATDATKPAPSDANPGEKPVPVGTIGKQTRDGADSQQGAQPDGLNPIYLMLPLILVFVFMMWSSSRRNKKERQKHEDMVKNLKRDDRVMLHNGKFVVIDKVEGDKVIVFGDVARTVREEYHRNSISGLAAEAAAAASAK